MVRLSLLCVLFSLMGLVVAQGSKPLAALLAAAAGGFVLWRALEMGGQLAERVRRITSAAGLDGTLLAPVVKVLGIALCARLSAELCRDMGSRWAAGAVELFGVLASAVCMLPLLEEVLKTVGSI